MAVSNDQLREQYQRRLNILEMRSATLGINTPAEVLMEIEDIREKLTELGEQPASQDEQAAEVKDTSSRISNNKKLVSTKYFIPIVLLIGIAFWLITQGGKTASNEKVVAIPFQETTIAIATPTLSTADWTQFVRVDSDCGFLPVLIPDTIKFRTVQDVYASRPEIDVFIDDETIYTCQGPLPKMPLIKENQPPLVGLLLYISSVLTDSTQVQIGSNIEVTVDAQPEVPEKSIAMGFARGAGGEFREFNIIPLNQDATSYTVERRVDTQEDDFFTVKQEDFEAFYVPLECENPGYYFVTIRIPFRHLGTIGKVVYRPQRIFCPRYNAQMLLDKNLETNDIQFTYLANYDWDGKKYIRAP